MFQAFCHELSVYKTAFVSVFEDSINHVSCLQDIELEMRMHHKFKTTNGNAKQLLNCVENNLKCLIKIFNFRNMLT